MTDFFAPFVPVIVVLLGIGVILGLPVGKFVKGMGARWLLFSALGVAFPLLLIHVRNNPPQNLQELGVWIGVALVAVLFLLRVFLGERFISEIIQGVIADAIYDLLKSLFRGTFYLFRGLFRGITRMFR